MWSEEYINEYKEQFYKSKCEIASDITHFLKLADYVNVGVQQFEWEGLPKEITQWNYIERGLFDKAMLMFFHTSEFGYLCVPCTGLGQINTYGRFVRVKPLITGIESQHLSVFKDSYEVGKDCVVIYDNMLRIPPIFYASYYAKKYSDILNTRDKNANFLKLPFIFSTKGMNNGKKKATAFKISQFMLKDKNEIAYVTDVFDNLVLLDLKPQYFGRELTELLKDIDNDYYEYLGVRHESIDKKERLTDDEVFANSEKFFINTNKRLNPRQKACEEINELFGLNISVKSAYHEFNEVKTSNIVASVAGGGHNDKTREQSKGDR